MKQPERGTPERAAKEDQITEETVKAGVRRVRTLDLLDKWKRAGIITSREYDAGRHVEELGYCAQIGPRYKSILDRALTVKSIGSSGGNHDTYARVELNQIFSRIGPTSASVLTDVLIHGMTLDEASRRRRWQQQSVNAQTVKGVILAALSTIVATWD